MRGKEAGLSPSGRPHSSFDPEVLGASPRRAALPPCPWPQPQCPAGRRSVGAALAEQCPSGPLWWERGEGALMIHDTAAAAQGLRAGYEAIRLELRSSGRLQPAREGCRGPGAGVRRTLLSRTGSAPEGKGGASNWSCQRHLLLVPL